MLARIRVNVHVNTYSAIPKKIKIKGVKIISGISVVVPLRFFLFFSILIGFIELIKRVSLL